MHGWIAPPGQCSPLFKSGLSQTEWTFTCSLDCANWRSGNKGDEMQRLESRVVARLSRKHQAARGAIAKGISEQRFPPELGVASIKAD
jgi:hypothetical protein